jgi:type IX secretion system PorP/SprF family membrane protein
MKRAYLSLMLYVALAACGPARVGAQGLQFSQYYNAPMLLNPANTALMPDNEYRAGANYRNQWSAVPVPYRTMSAYADFQAFYNETAGNWLGLGLAFFNDKAGNGDLSLNRFEGFAAYHLQMGYTTMLSAGLSGAYAQRSVDYNKLTFDAQWDGVTFNNTLPSNEQAGLIRTRFLDVGAGLNFAWFPTNAVYIKLGGGVAHVNQPKETFYNGTNRLGMRPTGNLDAFFRIKERFIANPSVYYTTQKSASQLVFGSLFQYLLEGEGLSSTQLLLGAFHRWQDALIPAFGFEMGGLQVMSSYDFTLSGMKDANRSRGAFEIGIMYRGLYGNTDGGNRSLYNCPRF